MMTKLLRSIGIPIVVRSFMVDYCDSQGNHFHKPLQSITPPYCVEEDADLVDGVRKKLKQEGYDVCGVQEVLGEFEMEELEEIFNGKQLGKYPMRALYLDAELVRRMAEKVTDRPPCER